MDTHSTESLGQPPSHLSPLPDPSPLHPFTSFTPLLPRVSFVIGPRRLEGALGTGTDHDSLLAPGNAISTLMLRAFNHVANTRFKSNIEKPGDSDYRAIEEER